MLIDYYLKLTIDQSRKHLSDDFFKQIQQRQSSFLRLIVFVIPYDRKQRLNSQFVVILRNLRNQIDMHDLHYFRYQMEIVFHIISKKSVSTDLNDLIQSIGKKLLESNIEAIPSIWNELMRQTFNIHFRCSSNPDTSDQWPMKFLQALVQQINWPCELNESSVKTTFIRLLNAVNAFLTNRVEKLEGGKFQARQEIPKNDDPEAESNLNNIDEEVENDDEDNDHQSELLLNQKQNSDLTKLENEILQDNSIFSSIEKWIQTVNGQIRFQQKCNQ